MKKKKCKQTYKFEKNSIKKIISDNKSNQLIMSVLCSKLK